MFTIGKLFLTILWVFAFTINLTNPNFYFIVKNDLPWLLLTFFTIHIIQYLFFYKKLKEEPFKGHHFIQILFFGMIHIKKFKK